MKLTNHLGHRLEIQVVDYRFKNLFQKLFDSDWLNVKLKIIRPDSIFSFDIENFLFEDFERIIWWLTNHSAKKKLFFADPNLVFIKTKRSGINFLKLIYFSSIKEFVYWDIELNKSNIENFKSKIESEMKVFPCRCGQKHKINR